MNSFWASSSRKLRVLKASIIESSGELTDVVLCFGQQVAEVLADFEDEIVGVEAFDDSDDGGNHVLEEDLVVDHLGFVGLDDQEEAVEHLELDDVVVGLQHFDEHHVHFRQGLDFAVFDQQLQDDQGPSVVHQVGFPLGKQELENGLEVDLLLGRHPVELVHFGQLEELPVDFVGEGVVELEVAGHQVVEEHAVELGGLLREPEKHLLENGAADPGTRGVELVDQHVDSGLLLFLDEVLDVFLGHRSPQRLPVLFVGEHFADDRLHDRLDDRPGLEGAAEGLVANALGVQTDLEFVPDPSLGHLGGGRVEHVALEDAVELDADSLAHFLGPPVDLEAAEGVLKILVDALEEGQGRHQDDLAELEDHVDGVFLDDPEEVAVAFVAGESEVHVDVDLDSGEEESDEGAHPVITVEGVAAGGDQEEGAEVQFLDEFDDQEIAGGLGGLVLAVDEADEVGEVLDEDEDEVAVGRQVADQFLLTQHLQTEADCFDHLEGVVGKDGLVGGQTGLEALEPLVGQVEQIRH